MTDRWFIKGNQPLYDWTSELDQLLYDRNWIVGYLECYDRKAPRHLVTRMFLADQRIKLALLNAEIARRLWRRRPFWQL